LAVGAAAFRARMGKTAGKPIAERRGGGAVRRFLSASLLPTSNAEARFALAAYPALEADRANTALPCCGRF